MRLRWILFALAFFYLLLVYLPDLILRSLLLW
jgi:hypothetical protein